MLYLDALFHNNIIANFRKCRIPNTLFGLVVLAIISRLACVIDVALVWLY